MDEEDLTKNISDLQIKNEDSYNSKRIVYTKAFMLSLANLPVSLKRPSDLDPIYCKDVPGNIADQAKYEMEKIVKSKERVVGRIKKSNWIKDNHLRKDKYDDYDDEDDEEGEIINSKSDADDIILGPPRKLFPSSLPQLAKRNIEKTSVYTPSVNSINTNNRSITSRNRFDRDTSDRGERYTNKINGSKPDRPPPGLERPPPGLTKPHHLNGKKWNKWTFY